MLHRLSNSERDVHFIHACENGHVHALREEVLGLASNQIDVRFIYRSPGAPDRAQNQFDAEGIIDKSFLQQFVPIGNYLSLIHI